MFRKMLLAALISAILPVHAAARWNEESLAAARVQAESEFRQYLKDGSGALNRFANAEIRELRQQADPAEKALLYKFIDAAKYRDKSRLIGLLSLAVSLHGNPDNALIDSLSLYESIMDDDRDSAPFAFAALDKLRPQFDEKQQQVYQYLVERYRFYLQDAEIDREQDQPQLCLTFSDPILAEPQQDWRQHITITPAPTDNGHYGGNRICYGGTWQTEYQVRIDGKLAAQNGFELGEAQERNISSGDREPMLRFATRGKTLVLDPEATLTIESSNINKVDLNLWQIPGNNLAGEAHEAIDNPNYFESYQLNDNASRIWSGSFAVENSKTNETVQNRVAFAEMAGKEARAGVYVLSIENGDEDAPYQSPVLMGFTVTDQGLTAYHTGEGLLAELRDLRNNQPIAGQTITLYAQNNRILGEAVTDAHGIVRFSRAQTGGNGSDAISHIISQYDKHLAYLRVSGQGIDLSDKGLDGKENRSPTLSHWSWHDRGVYRPKDTINALWLFKTPEGKAFADSPLWLEIRRPDGALVHSQLLNADDSGAYRYSSDIPANARLGAWNLRISLGKNGVVLVDEDYHVESIVPQQIESRLSVKAEGDNKASLDLSADWLYGSPAAGLLTDGVWRLKNGDLGQTYPAWTGWQIGRHDQSVATYDEQRINTANTDKNGKRHIEIILDRPFDTRPQTLWAATTLTAPDGSTIRAENQTLLPRSAPYIALKAGDEDDHAQIAVINDHGEAQEANLTWTLYRVKRNWYWYRNEGEWQYENNDSRHALKTGQITTDSKTPATLELPPDNGIYILEVQGQDPASAASLEISRGWYGNPGQNNPAAITLATDREQYRNGDTLTLNLQAPFDGLASVKIASRDNIIQNHDIQLKNGKAQLQLPWQEDWEQGIWLLANAWNNNSNDHNRRAVGLHWVGANLEHRRLEPQISTPENPQPNQPLTINIHVPKAGDNTWVNLAVVDDGLYQLAAASFTDPLEAFFGKKQLSINLYDTFGNIIRQTGARLAALRSGAGGDESEGERAALADLPDLDLTLVAHWSGPLKLDADGNTQYTVPLPHYNGRLRIMAAAWNKTQNGGGEQTAVIKAPIVAELHSPRYLSQDDSGIFSLRLHNTTDKNQSMNIALEAQGLELVGEPIPQSSLAPDQTITLQYPFHSKKAGEARIKIHLSGDYQETIERRIPVRTATLPQSRSQYLRLKSGGSVELADLKQARLNINAGIPYNPEPYQQQLAAYPLGCSEQTTGKLWGLLAAANPRREHIREAENRLANLAYYNGGYSLWGDGQYNRWLTAYVGEALIQLQKQQQLHNPQQLDRLLKNLRENTDGSYNAKRTHADSYAYYTLAYAGEPVRGNLLRYHREAAATLNINDSLDIATALALLGEYQAASERLRTITTEENSGSYSHYSSETSLAAHSLVRLKQLETLWKNVKNDPENTAETINSLYKEQRKALQQSLTHDQYLSTQELAWLVRLTTVAPKLAADTPLEINGEKTTLAALGNHEHNGSLRITNPGTSPLWLDVRDLHAPAATEASSQGWDIAITYQSADGTTLDPAKLPNNTDLRITATFTPTGKHGTKHNELIYTYPLPAGITLGGLRDEQNDNEESVAYQYRENRDDRHIAAFTVESTEPFSYTIYGRTTRAGTWHAPGASLENMYHPEEHARQAAQQIIVQ